MKTNLFLAIIVLLTAASAEATLPTRTKCSADDSVLAAAAKSSLSADGQEVLQQIFATKTNSDRATVGSVFFLEPAIRADLNRGDVKRVKRFLKVISDKRAVKCQVVGGGRASKGRGIFRIVYSLEEPAAKESPEMAGAASQDTMSANSSTGKRYIIRADKIRQGESTKSGSDEYEIRLGR